MGQAKNRGTFAERKAEGEFKRSLLKQKFDAWNTEVEEFRKLFGLDVGVIGGAPPEARLVVCKLDALRTRLLGLTPPSVDAAVKAAGDEAAAALAAGGKED